MSELEEFEEEFSPRGKDKPFIAKLLCDHKRGVARGCMSLATVRIGTKAYCAFHAPKPKQRRNA